MGYIESLEAAGAVVLDSEFESDYQGAWAALVEYKGQVGFTGGYFGSCSGCDAFEAELGYDYHECKDAEGNAIGERWGEKAGPDKCAECADYLRRLEEFGQSYLDDLKTVEQVRADQEYCVANPDEYTSREDTQAFIILNRMEK